MSNTGTHNTEYSKIGGGTDDFSRLDNVIGNIKHAANVIQSEGKNPIYIHFVTKSRGKEAHRMIYHVEPADLSDSQKKVVDSFRMG